MRIFISYGAPDEAFASALERDLNSLGLETFLFKKHAAIGRKLHRLMRDEINSCDYIVLVCSENSLSRPGVLNEIEEALAREARSGGNVCLLPIMLDDFVLGNWAPMYSGHALAIRDRVVADFRGVAPGTDAFRELSISLRDGILSEYGEKPSRQMLNAVYSVTVLDPMGDQADVLYSATFRALKSGIEFIELPNVSFSNDLQFVSFDKGELDSVIDEGGRKRYRFRLESTPSINELFSFNILMRAIGCHRDETNTALITPHVPHESIGLSVMLPDARPAKAARLIRANGPDRIRLKEISVSAGSARLEASVPNPVVNASYILEWDW